MSLTEAFKGVDVAFVPSARLRHWSWSVPPVVSYSGLAERVAALRRLAVIP
jgi:hypothetical protein